MLFSLKKHFECNEIPNITVFSWPSHDDPKAQIYFSIEERTAYSLPKTPYAGFQFQGAMTETDMGIMVSDLMAFLQSHRVDAITIKQSPVFFNPNSTILHNALTQLGFNFTTDINHHIDTSPWLDDFSPVQKRKVNKCIKEGLVFSSHLNIPLEDLYGFIAKCRKQQNLEVNINASQFKRLFTNLPDHFQAHTVINGSNDLLACLVTIKVTEKIEYSFLPAFDRNFGHLSPLSFLFHCYLKEANKTCIETVDLGISSIEGAPQNGLVQFKEAIGGIRSDRMIYTLKM